MAQTCTVCRHDRREEIDIDVTRGLPLREIAQAYGVDHRAVDRHKKNHLSPALIATKKAQGGAHHRSLLERLESLAERCEGYLDDAEREYGEAAPSNRDMRLILAAARELRGALEVYGKATGELNDRPTTVVNVNTDPMIAQLQAIILGALEPYPEAAQAVAAALVSGHVPEVIDVPALGVGSHETSGV